MSDREMETIKKTLEAFRSRLDMVDERFKKGRINYNYLKV